MATALATCILTSVTWCFCQACTSLMGACCGNDKPSTVPPGAASGRKRSVLLLLLSIGVALGYQWGVAPALVKTSTSIPNWLSDAWVSDCEQFETDVDLQKVCAGNNGNYRASFAAAIFFILAAIAAKCKPTANREAWPAKYVLYIFLAGVMIFIPSKPLFSDIFLNLARIGGICFILFQQVVIVDVAYNWNDNWVAKADAAETEEMGSGKKWLVAILLSCILMYGIWLAGIIYMFIDFSGCESNEAFMALTLILPMFITAAQLTGEEGSLLSSGCVAAWASFLCYNAVSKNPDASCNPRLGETDQLSIVVGLLLTLVSLGWAGWSYTAEDKLRLRAPEEQAAPTAPSSSTTEIKAGNGKVTGLVTGSHDANDNDAVEEAGYASANDSDEEPNGPDPNKLSNSWKLNVALIFVVCWQAMVLTGWGSIAINGTLANPSTSRTGMWMIIASQWIALTLYLWTLMAPRLFPDRDFS